MQTSAVVQGQCAGRNAAAMRQVCGWSVWPGQCLRPQVAAAAKKGGKGGKQSALAGLLEKKAKAEAATIAAPDQYRDPEVRALLLFICNSYYKHLKKPLIEADFETLPDAIFNAPFVLLAHDGFAAGVKEPRFTYANRAGLELFEAKWDELIGLPSSRSAADVTDVQQDRNSALANASSSGVILDYSGPRKSLKGNQFTIKGVTLFTVQDAAGDVIGQAAFFDRYEDARGKEVVVQGYADETAAAVAAAAAALPPSEEELATAAAGVAQWAEYVRNLKEVQGLTNKDPSVQEAVGNLQAWKAQQTALQKRLDDALAAAKAAFDDDEDEGEEDA